MSVRFAIRACVVAALCACAPRAQAQLRPRVLSLPASTRAAAMGGAFGISLVDSDAVFYNAAFNDRLRGASLSVGAYGEKQTHYTLSAGTDWFGGALGVGLQSLDYGNAYEHLVAVVYARRIKGARMAFTAKLLEHRLGDEEKKLLMGDVATSFTYRALSLGAAAQNVGPQEYYLVDEGAGVPGPLQNEEAKRVPLRGLLNVATARSFPIGPLDIAGAATLAYEREGEFLPGAGVELSYYPVTGRTFYVRAGVKDPGVAEKPYTFGGGFAGDRIVLDYALELLEQGLETHRFGLRWR